MSDFDAVISIGGQAFLEGFWRILGPALQAVRSPIPIAVPGLTNSALRIRQLVPRFDLTTDGKVTLDVYFEVVGDVLVTANVASGTLQLSIGELDLKLEAPKGTLKLPTDDITLNLEPVTGNLVGGAVINLKKSTGTFKLPASPGTVALDDIAGKLTVPVNVGDLTVPFPTLAPVATDFNKTAPLVASIGFKVMVNQAVNADSGFGLLFGAFVASPPEFELPTEFKDVLKNSLTDQFTALIDKLSLPATVTQAPHDFDSIAKKITETLPKAVTSALSEVFLMLIGRTGRLVFDQADSTTSCDVRALPTNARARLVVTSGGALFLQVGFRRGSIPSAPSFPPFTPTELLNVQVNIDNKFLLRLICCLLEKLPNLALPARKPDEFSDDTKICCHWNGITLNLGVISLRGSLSVCIYTPIPSSAMEQFTDEPSSGKTIRLEFDLSEVVGAPPIPGFDHPPGEVLKIALKFQVPISIHLNDLSSIVGLPFKSIPNIETLSVELGDVLKALLVVGGGPLPGVIILTALPLVVAAIAQHLLRNTVDTVFQVASLLTSPPAIPEGIFDAFGKLVPASITVDDLIARCTLSTPTSPWALLPPSLPTFTRLIGVLGQEPPFVTDPRFRVFEEFLREVE